MQKPVWCWKTNRKVQILIDEPVDPAGRPYNLTVRARLGELSGADTGVSTLVLKDA